MNPSRATIPLIRPHQCDSDGGRIRGVLLYYHKITYYGINAACMRTLRRHVHRQAAANCTDAKLYFLTIFQFFFFIQMGPGPTHPLPNYFWIFGIFLTLQSPLCLANIRLLTDLITSSARLSCQTASPANITTNQLSVRKRNSEYFHGYEIIISTAS